MEKNKKNWVMLGIVTLALFFILKLALMEYAEPYDDDQNQDKVTCPNIREGEFCTEEYDPVCGWFNASKIQCIKYPCAQTFSNGCFACLDDKVDYWTKGECPK
jgi:hypothetical protein